MAHKDEATESVHDNRHVGDWRPDRIFWGGALVLLGGLLLLNTLGVLSVDVWSLWKLWPLLIIAVGISLFAPKGIIARVSNIALLVVTVLLALYVTTSAPNTVQTNGDVQSQSFSRNLVGVNSAGVTVEGGAIALNFNTAAMRNIVDAKLDSENFELKTSNSTSKNQQNVTIDLESKGFPWIPTSTSTLDVTIGRELPLDLTIDSGASKISGDLSEAHLRNLTFDAGASSVDLKLGDKQTIQRVDVNGGASSITLRLPKSAGVQIKMDAGLVSKDFDGIDEVSEDTYETNDFAGSERKIYITINAGASKLSIKRY